MAAIRIYRMRNTFHCIVFGGARPHPEPVHNSRTSDDFSLSGSLFAVTQPKTRLIVIQGQRKWIKNGFQVDPVKVFKWDGIDSCWSGRRADRFNAKYDPHLTYGAHQSVGGFQSDELWSTPLVSSLLELATTG